MMMNSSATARTPTSFLHLPYELRLQIYCNCLPFKQILDLHPLPHDRQCQVNSLLKHDKGISYPKSKLPRVRGEEGWARTGSAFENTALPNILVASRQISNEALDILYGENIFHIYLFSKGEDQLKRVISRANRARIRHILLVLYGDFSFTLDSTVWNDFLPLLKSLRIVTTEPVFDCGHKGPNPRECKEVRWREKRKEWLEWLERIVNCISQTVSSNTVVLVERGDEDATKLIQKHLPQGDQRHRTLFGEFIIRRERHSRYVSMRREKKSLNEFTSWDD